MAVNKNFVVKNGLEVDTNTLLLIPNNRVAIGTTILTASLDVRGKILSDSQVESWVGKFVGIVTTGAVGVTTMTATDATVTGFSTLGRANVHSECHRWIFYSSIIKCNRHYCRCRCHN